ncbi:MhpD 2-keto-4-pentenoate hydratase/2-oxohepta-3-ene-1,7-dioic acid hydratase (catechol pathway) [Candidatus Nanopelagicaceae bacterium]|jgi:2,4-didehydro-3-deoxy-L-rhamnonate hydrolase
MVMKIARFGQIGSERPAVMVNQTQAVYVDHLIKDWNRDELVAGALDKVKSADLSSLAPFDIAGLRIGSPVARPTKLICIGLNYARHAAESGMTPPPEPVVFMKAPDCLIGPNDEIAVPPNSTATDYEVELSIVIGKRALYLKSESEARSHILGYSISQDVSERHWQIERAGQWVKGKSFPTFNPMGPVIVTSDEFNPDDVRLYCNVDGEKRQDSRTSDLIFGIDHIVWYVSQFMELFPGDIINTGTPEGVGMGFKPTKYLQRGQKVVTGIEGIGEMVSQTI